MDFFKALFDLLGNSKRWVAAIFIASAAFLCPFVIKPFGTDPQWNIHWCAVGLLFLTGGFLLTIVLEQLYSWLRSFSRWARLTFINMAPLTEFEEAILEILGRRHATDSFDVDSMSNSDDLTKLEFIDQIDQLKRRGLVRTHRIYPTLVSLTARGRKRALEIINRHQREEPSGD